MIKAGDAWSQPTTLMRLTLALLLTLGLSVPVAAAPIVYTDLASFQAAAGPTSLQTLTLRGSGPGSA